MKPDYVIYEIHSWWQDKRNDRIMHVYTCIYIYIVYMYLLYVTDFQEAIVRHGDWFGHESVRMLPVRLALCDLEAPGWGEPWFPHCAVVASWLTDFCTALCGLLFRFVLHCHTNP